MTLMKEDSWQDNVSVDLSFQHPLTSKKQAQQLISNIRKQIQSHKIRYCSKSVNSTIWIECTLPRCLLAHTLESLCHHPSVQPSMIYFRCCQRTTISAFWICNGGKTAPFSTISNLFQIEKVTFKNRLRSCTCWHYTPCTRKAEARKVWEVREPSFTGSQTEGSSMLRWSLTFTVDCCMFSLCK